MLWLEVYIAIAFLAALCLWQLLFQPRWAKRSAAREILIQADGVAEENDLAISASKVERGEGANVVSTEPQTRDASKGVPERARMHYLDVIKSFLTGMVVTHHAIGVFKADPSTGSVFVAGEFGPFQTASSFSVVFASVFLDLEQSYFMALFFFITGYFTPSSLDRKGVNAFLADRCKRIAIPSLVYVFLWGPFCNFMAHIWTFGGPCGPDFSDAPSFSQQRCYQYSLYPGPTWYLHWLLFFSCIYAWTYSSPSKVPVPSISHLVILALAHGVWFALMPWGDSFFLMPGGIHSLISYVMFFFGGVSAKRNDWMSTMLDFLPCATWLLRGLAVLCAVLGFSMAACQQWAGADAVSFDTLRGFLVGFFAIVWTLVLLHFCKLHFNEGSRLARFFGDNAYAVYLLHFFFLNFSTWTWSRLLGSRTHALAADMGGISIVGYWMPSVDGGDSEGWLWCGMLYTVVLTQLLVWPSAHLLRKLPGVKQVL